MSKANGYIETEVAELKKDPAVAGLVASTPVADIVTEVMKQVNDAYPENQAKLDGMIKSAMLAQGLKRLYPDIVKYANEDVEHKEIESAPTGVAGLDK